MVKKLFLGLVALVVVLAIVIATRPSTYHVERSRTMNVPAEAVFEQVNDFHKWQSWSPWEKLDPNQQRTLTGPDSGVGASYAWSGNDQVGEGRMTIEESRANEHVGYKLEFIKPMASTCKTAFDLKTVDGQVTVNWSMDGENDFMGKAFSLVMDMDKMIGKDFETGLENLQKEAEAAQAKKEAEAAEAAKAAEAAQAAEAEAAVAAGDTAGATAPAGEAGAGSATATP